jgi:hypothetical protein
MMDNLLNSESIPSKIGMLVIVIIVFVILLRIGIMILTKFVGHEGFVKLFDGMVKGNELTVIKQDPSYDSSKTIYRSVNANEGIEFTWSCWVYLDDMTYNQDKFRCIFYKGNSKLENDNTPISETGLNFPNNSPGLYLEPNKNNLVVMMNTFTVINEQIVIRDVPVKKWINVIIRCQNKTIDVYINGTISKSFKLIGVPRQNYGNVYVGANGGFSGYVSNLWYYNHALGIYEINDISSRGPNTTMISTSSDDAINLKNSDYISLRWFFYGITPEPRITINSDTSNVNNLI